MENLEKTEYLNNLYSFYGDLLTIKQQTYFKLYYFEDQSLFEIAEMLGVSRNAVYDQLKIAEKHLTDYEAKLGLLKLAQKRKTLIDLYEKTKDFNYINELRKLDE